MAWRRTKSMECCRASRSKRFGRQTSSERSARRAACRVSSPSTAGVSITIRSQPELDAADQAGKSLPAEAETTAGPEWGRMRPHRAAERCGSRSTSTVFSPARQAATARFTDRVVLPTPPLREMTARVRIPEKAFPSTPIEGPMRSPSKSPAKRKGGPSPVRPPERLECDGSP